MLKRGWANVWRRLGLTRTGQVAVVAAIVPWIAARLVAGTTLYVLAYGTLGVVAAAALLVPRRLRIRAHRVGLSPRAQQGDRLQVDVIVEADRTITSFQLEEHVPPEVGYPLRVPIARLRAGEQLAYGYSLHCSRRGAYRIGPLAAVTQDPIGVAQRATVLAEPFELLVHPRVQPVSDRPLTRLFEDPPIRPPVSRPWPSGMELYGMREYRPGDDLRRIVWRATARAGRLIVSEAEQGVTDHLTLVLDTDRGGHSRDGESSESFEFSVSACASLAVRHLTDGYEVRVEAGAGPIVVAARGQHHILPVLDALARVTLDRAPLSGTLGRLTTNPRRDAHTVLITPRLDTHAAALVQLLLDKGVSLTIIGVVWNSDADALAAAAALGVTLVPVNISDNLAEALGGNHRYVRPR